MSATQRNKGKRGELEAVRLLQAIYPDARRRVVNHAGVEDGVDLDNTGALRVQVKRQARYVPVTTLDEVRDDSGIPVVLTKCDRGEWRVIMRASDLLHILADVGIAYEEVTP